MKKKFLKSLLALALAGMLVFSVACGTKTDDTTPTGTATESKDGTALTEAPKEALKISLLTSQSRYRPIYQTISEQLLADEKITIDWQSLPDDQYDQTVKLKLASGEVPEIMDINIPSTIIQIGVEKFVDLSDQPWVARLTNPNLTMIDGKFYGLPKESSSAYIACYYNKKVMDSLGITDPNPTTYADFLSILETIKTKGNGITPFYASNKDAWTPQIFMSNGFSIALAPNEVATYEQLNQNKLNWSDVPEFKSILNDYNDLYKMGYVNKDHLTATYDMAKEAVATGKAAMMLNGEWCATDIMAKWPDTELGAFIIPFSDKQLIGTGSFAQGLTIPSACKNIEGSKRFLDVWSQTKYQNVYWAENPGFPGLKDVDGGNVLPCVQSLVDNYIVTNKYVFEMNGYTPLVGNILSDLWKSYIEMAAGNKTPEQVLENWDVKFKDFMKAKEQPGF